MLNIRRVILSVTACLAIPSIAVLSIHANYYLNYYLALFVISNFQPGILLRIRILMPLTLIGAFAVIRFAVLRFDLIDRARSEFAEGLCRRAIAHTLPAGLTVAIGLAFAGWLPHYLYWPWWMDLEHFAMTARMWDSGVRPYRDIVDFNFPGPAYFMWSIGKIFGWGRPMVANAIDVIWVVAICWLVIVWSVKRFGTKTPGLFSAFLIVRYYFSLDYSRVMQREWYLCALSIAAICLVQMRVARPRWLLAGVLMALAGSLRPYAILSVIPTMVALWTECDPRLRNRAIEMAKFLSSVAVITVILWFPLVAHGIFDDFLRSLMDEARRGFYGSASNETLTSLLRRQIDTKIVFTGIVGLAAALYAKRHSEHYGMIVTWAIGFVAMFFYMPLCPVRHAYTEIPLELFACIASGIGLWVLLGALSVASSLKAVVVLVWFSSQFPGWPQYCEFRASFEALSKLVRWADLPVPPPGCRSVLATKSAVNTIFVWSEYQEVLRFIRERTNEETHVANFVWLNPFPAFNGPTGRKIVFPCAEGILWLRSVNPGLESRFAQALESDERSIVITLGKWNLAYEQCPYPMIEAVIRKHYEPWMTIGNYVIHVRKTNLPAFPAKGTTPKPE